MNTNNTAIITLTPAAQAHISGFLKPASENVGFRVGVKKSGCSGFAYLLDIAEPQAGDIRLEQGGVPIFVAEDSVQVLQGSVVDLVEKEVNQKQLVFNNPNVVDSCGCGESFTVQDEGKQ